MTVRAGSQTPSDELQREGVVKSRIAGGLLATIVLLFFVIGNLPFQYVESEVTWVGNLEVLDSSNYGSLAGMPVMAGWPLRYWIRYVDGDLIEDRVWLPTRLLVNLAIGLCLSLVVYWFLQFRRQKLSEAPESRRRRTLFDCAVALAIVVVPLAIFGWQYRITYRHQRIASLLVGRGNTCLSTWFPAPLDRHVPVGLKRRFARIRKIQIYRADEQLVRAITSIPSLVSYQCYSGRYENLPFDKVIESPHFRSLQLTGRELSDVDIETIGKLRWLVQLRLSYTNMDAERLKRLDHLRPGFVDLSFTDIVFAEIGKPGWSTSVERLWLSRPEDGIESSLTLDDWPRLKQLRIKRRSEFLNDAVLSLRLINLPRLERLSIDRVQKYDFIIRNVPRLARFDEELVDSQFVTQSNLLIPGMTWVRDVEIDGADSLTSLSCFARDLRTLSIRRTPVLHEMALGSFLSSLLGDITPQTVDAEKCAHWIEHIGQREGPASLNLSYLPLAGIDLTPLAENKRIRHLGLNGTGITFEQVKCLAGMNQLETLDMRSTPLEQDALAELLSEFPKMKKLSIDSGTLAHFDLTGMNQLRELRVTPMDALDELRIVDLPKLRATIRMTRPPRTLEIRNVPSLRGLSVEGPWPDSAIFHGLRDLEWFTGGGEAITDEVASEVLNCPRIDRLTLAYPSVSEDMLRRIGQLKELTFLALPGAKVNDSVVRDWSRLDKLWEVNLDDTGVSEQTIAWLSRIESLRRLSINRVALSDDAADALVGMTQLGELRMAGAPIDCERLRALLVRGNLETLDLSGWEFNERLMNVLCSEGDGLKHLIVNDTALDKESFQRLLEAAPSMFVEMRRLPDYVKGASLAELHRRAQLLRREMNTGWRLMLKSPHDTISRVSPNLFASDNQDPYSGVPQVPTSFMSQLSRQVFAPPRLSRP